MLASSSAKAAGRRLLLLRLHPLQGTSSRRRRPLGRLADGGVSAPGPAATRGYASSRGAAQAPARLYTMGEGYYGALGQGDFIARARLTPVLALDGVAGGIRDAACGWAHAAVATGEGRLLLFGRPHDVRKALSLRHMWQSVPWLVRANQAMKRLLDNPQPSSGEQYYREDVLLSPREFPLPEGERAWRVACSGALTAVVTESGRVFCMGANAFGQCGLGAGGTSSGTANEGAASLAGSAASATNVWTPLSPVTGLPDAEEDPVEEACLGFQHALVRTRGGRAFAWGKGERGQLGNGATANHPSAFPLDLPEGTPPVVKVAAGFNHGAALTADGGAWVWGKMQALGVKEAGRGGGRPAVHDDQLFPRRVPLPERTTAVDLACGHFHTSVLLRSQQAQQAQQQSPLLLCMFGMRAGLRSVEPAPAPVALPPLVGVVEGQEEWALGGAMAHTVLYARGSGQAFKAEFEGGATAFVSVVAPGEEPGEEGEEEGAEGNAQPPSSGRVLNYAEGLAHRLVLLEEEG